MKYILDGIHGNSKASGIFVRKITLCDTPMNNDRHFKTLFTFFEKTFKRTSDLEAYVRIAKHIEKEKSDWSYTIHLGSQAQHQFYLSDKALEQFKFWYPESKLVWA